MNKVDLEKLMGNVFIEDMKSHNKYTYISQIGILAIKSLIPSTDDLGVRVNYKRFLEELNLWKGYRTGDNFALLNIEEKDQDIYWKERDNSIFSRAIPIILANQEFNTVEEELIKNILFTTGNLRDMFEHLSIAYLIYLILEKEEDILDKLKEKIISFGQVEFLNKYEMCYKLPLETYRGNYKVDFEKEKIQIISLLNGVDSKEYIYLLDLIKVIDKEKGNTFIGRVFHGFLYGREVQFDLPRFYLNLGIYLVNLRKSRINPRDLEIEEYILPDIFTFNEGEVFFHSLLQNSKIIKKEVKAGVLTSLVQTKTGMYLFKKIDL